MVLFVATTAFPEGKPQTPSMIKEEIHVTDTLPTQQNRDSIDTNTTPKPEKMVTPVKKEAVRFLSIQPLYFLNIKSILAPQFY